MYTDAMCRYGQHQTLWSTSKVKSITWYLNSMRACPPSATFWTQPAHTCHDHAVVTPQILQVHVLRVMTALMHSCCMPLASPLAHNLWGASKLQGPFQHAVKCKPWKLGLDFASTASTASLIAYRATALGSMHEGKALWLLA